jgi:hypothetical protein
LFVGWGIVCLFVCLFQHSLFVWKMLTSVNEVKQSISEAINQSNT